MHGNQWVLKIAVLKYYSVSKRGTTAKSNPKQATDPISLHTKFGDNSSNTFPLNERKPCVTPDIGRRTSDAGHRTAKKAKTRVKWLAECQPQSRILGQQWVLKSINLVLSPATQSEVQ